MFRFIFGLIDVIGLRLELPVTTNHLPVIILELSEMWDEQFNSSKYFLIVFSLFPYLAFNSG
jgi:hypothetical protein